jgi:glycosyltransferase involved in cell wall biosynthesis
VYKFSIITVVYNAKEDLVKTVKSILNQTCKDFEQIIIDGGSDDGTADYIKSLKYNNLRYVSEKDNGIYDAMNKGIELSSGEYLLFLNAGDNFTSNETLENIINKLNTITEKPKVIYGGANVYSENVNLLSALKPLDLNIKNLNRFATRTVCHQSIFVHKDSVKRYSNKYRFKGELNWYYDLVNSVNETDILKLDDIVCDYYLGGMGDVNFWENYIERIQVTKDHNPLFVFILNIPFFALPLLFRFRRKIFGK